MIMNKYSKLKATASLETICTACQKELVDAGYEDVAKW
jgi:hypothetical protein